MFRCTKCAQGQKVNVKFVDGTEATLISNATMDKLSVQIGDKVIADETDKEYENVKASIDSLDMTQEVTCHCGHADTLENFADANSEPLKYFEMADLCHCGGELWMDNIPGSNRYGFVCDRCNWVKPNKFVSGAAE